MQLWPGIWSAASRNRGGVVLVSSRNASLVEGELVTDDGDRRLSEEAQDLDDHLRGVASDLGLPRIKKKRRPWKVTFLFLILLMAAIGILFVVIFQPDLLTSRSESLDASGTEPTVADQGAVSTSSVTGQGTPSSDSDPGVEGDPSPPAEGDGAAYAPIEVHVDVGAEDSEVSDQHISSFFQIWPALKTGDDLPPVATPHLSGGTFDIVLDFEAMTVSGSFDLAYERDGDEETLCLGSPEAFSGSARGTFEDLPIRKAETSETPPSDWGLPAEDWWPMEADGWYVGGSFPVELAMSGVAVVGCATLDGVTTYGEVPFDETATITSWMKMTIDMHRNQGADHKTVAWVDLYTTTNEAFTVKPYWDHSFAWSQVFEHPIPDPLG